MKVEVDFPAPFDREGQVVLPIHLGRLMLGSHIARLYFKPNGTMTLAVDKRAIEDGSIVLTETCSDDSIVMAGFKP